MIIKVNLAFNFSETPFLDIVYKTDTWEYKLWYTNFDGDDGFTPEMYDSYSEYLYVNQYVAIPLFEFES